jgi:hypothetical protein
MSEIYWITRLSILAKFSENILIVCFILAMVGIIMFPLYSDLNNTFKNICKKGFKWYCFALFFCALGTIFIPTQKDLFLIYGIGGTIDYIKSNDKAKQLPDKCIDALTRYVDSIEKENEDNK